MFVIFFVVVLCGFGFVMVEVFLNKGWNVMGIVCVELGCM